MMTSMNIQGFRRTWTDRGLAITGTAGIAAALVLTCSAAAQRGLDRGDRWDDRRPAAPTPIEATRGTDDSFADPSTRRHPGLLREGAVILEAPATVQFDEEFEMWSALLHLDGRDRESHEPRTMRLLPNSFLSEMVQIIEATTNQRITFELTGETLVYEGMNYLLLRAPVRVIGLERIERVATAPSAAPPELPELERRADEPQATRRRSAAEVMRELEREAGPLHRTPLVPRTPLPADSPEGATGQPAPQRATAPGQAAATDRRQWREGTLLVQRRGRITREAGGSWRFVFDADAQGLADPPLTLMPSLLLERIDRFARQAGPTQPVLISGEVFVHNGRAYLLPSAFQLPRERTPLN